MDSNQPYLFGDLLRSFRLAADLTQEELAERADLSARGISDLERGAIKAPWRSTVLKLADALHLSPTERERFLTAQRNSTPRVAKQHAVTPYQQPSVLQLIGRTQEQAQIQQMLLGHEPQMLGFYGEPGIGKTRLLTEAEAQARQAGWTVLWGGSQRADGQHPYTPIVQALERHLAAQTPAQRRRAVRECEWMMRLFPALADASPPPAQTWRLPPDQERHLIFAAVGRYLARIAEPDGVLLILDDLQWAEPDGLSLLTSLMRAAVAVGPTERLCVIAASRDAQFSADHPLPRMLNDLAHESLVTWNRLDPLPSQHAETLLRLALSDIENPQEQEREALIRRTLERGGGIPLFLTSFAREIRANWLAGRHALSDEDIPWDVAEMIRQRINTLPTTARDLLAVAAVHGRATPLSVLVLAGDVTERQAIEAVEVAYSERLLKEMSDGSCTFAHDLICEVMLATLSVARRNMLHRRIAEALELDPQRMRVEPLAFHYGQSAVTDRAATYLEQAGDQALALRAYAAANAHYRGALRHLEPLENVEATARVQLKLGELLLGSGNYDEALAMLEDAAESYRRVGDSDEVGHAVAQIGWAHVRRGTAEEGMRRLEPLLAPNVMAQRSVSTQASLWRAHAVLLFALNRYPEQLISASHACALAHQVDDQGALAQGKRLQGLAFVLLGRLTEAAPVLEETIRIAEAVGDLDSYSAALNDAAAVARLRGDLKASWNYSARAVEAIERLGDPMGRAFLTSSHGQGAFLLGDWRAARNAIEHAVAIVREMGTSWVAAYPFADLGQLELAEGHDEAAVVALGEALAFAERGHDKQALRHVQSVIAERDLISGVATDAIKRLEPLIDLPAVSETESTQLLPLLAWACLTLGQLDRADRLLRECRRQVEATGARLVTHDALLVQARLHLARNEWQQAEQLLREALALAREMAHPYAEAKVLSLRGVVLARRGDWHGAHTSLHAALNLFEHLGERYYSPQAAALLRQLETAGAPLTHSDGSHHHDNP